MNRWTGCRLVSGISAHAAVSNPRRPGSYGRRWLAGAVKLRLRMSLGTAGPVGDVGRHVPAFSSALRPRPIYELAEWGGPALVLGKRVLDLGCGDGRFALGVASFAASVEGIDPDEEGIAAAKKAARKVGARNVRFGVGAGQRLPCPDGAFDVVILSWTL